MLTFPCPNCGKTLSLPIESAGKTCKCAACGQEMTVSRPSPPQVKRVPPKPPMEEEIPEVLPAFIPPVKSRTSKSSRKTDRVTAMPKGVWLLSIPVVMVFVCCGGLFIIGLTKTDGRRGTQGSSATTAPSAVNADPEGSLLKIWLALRTCERKTGGPPENRDMFAKYLNQQGDASEIMKGIGMRTGFGWPPEVAIAWQETSRDGKYYILFGSGRIDHLDEDEMAARGASVGKRREQSHKAEKDRIRKQLKDNEEWWLRRQEDYEEEERKDDAYEKQLKIPEKNPTLEKIRKGNLPFEMKVLSERREGRKRNLEVQRRAYEQQKKRFEEELKR